MKNLLVWYIGSPKYLFFIFPYHFTGNYVLAWKKGIAILTAGGTKVTPDKRIRLVDGYNLEIRDIQTKDAGNYVCHIATMEPREITHTVEILGEFC